MEEFNYPNPIIDFSKNILSIEEIKEKDEFINTLSLKQKISIKGNKIETIGELKKYIKNYEIIEKLFNFLDEEDYIYIIGFKIKENGYL